MACPSTKTMPSMPLLKLSRLFFPPSNEDRTFVLKSPPALMCETSHAVNIIMELILALASTKAQLESLDSAACPLNMTHTQVFIEMSLPNAALRTGDPRLPAVRTLSVASS